jgi:hypothetical protein
MGEINDLWVTVLFGTLATTVMDLGSLLLRRFAGVPLPNYAMVGRWIGHMPAGRLRHRAIAATPAVRGERVIGWVVHYLTGIAFAALLLAICGFDWLRSPTFVPAMLVALATVAAPFLLMQPCMGAGIAARRAPDPATVRLRSLINHGLFGLGLYAAGHVMQLLLDL